jgi:hypothetical protein
VDDFMAKELQCATEKVCIQKGSEVTDVGHVVDRWSTRVKGDGPGWVPRAQWFGRSAQRIMKLQHLGEVQRSSLKRFEKQLNPKQLDRKSISKWLYEGQ